MAFRLKLEIENPCSENWEQMMPDEKGRFCMSCTKQVIDFSKMTDQELIRFFKQNRKTEMCGQLSSSQLDRVLIESSRRRWLPYFLQATLPAMLLLNRAGAQQTGLTQHAAVVKEIKGATGLKESVLPATAGAPIVIKGNIIDHEGKPVAYASVKVMGTEQYSLADSSGNFQIHYWGTVPEVKLSCSALSFGDTVAVFDLQEQEQLCTIRLQPKELPEVVVQSNASYRLGGLRWSVTKSYRLSDTVRSLVNRFKLYPNPARSFSTIKIELPEGYDGEVVLRLLSISGQVLHTQKYQAPKGMNALNFPVPQVTPGTYLMQIGSVTKKEWVSEKIVIQ